MRFGRHGGVAALFAALLGSICISVAGTAIAQQVDVAQAEATWTRWFVEMKSPPTSDGSSLATVRNEKNAFRKEAQQAGIAFKEKHSFDVLWNGVSIEVSPAQASALKRLPSVKAVYPVELIAMPLGTVDEAADMATALNMTGASIAQNELGLTGAGVRVAVMDTGIDYHHPDLGGCFGPGCRVVAGWDFVGDAFNADPASSAYNPVAVPDNNPDDCGGHGTHVAGIIGANGTGPNTVRGVAPGVTFGAYRVFGCAGSTTADIMIAAMERALADGMHVLNMSIGSSFQWPQYPTAQAADRLVNRGVSVVASIGNSGASGLYAAGAPGVGKKVIGVASYDNTHVALASFTVTPDGRSIGYTEATAAPPAPKTGTLTLARTGTPVSTADACAALPPGSLTGKAVLIRRGTCGFYNKALNAQSAGAAAVVLYNNVPGRINPTVAGAVPITIPVVAISDTEGVAINGFIAANAAVVLTWTANVGSFGNATGNLISSFSSYGMAADLSLKPDIGAPGGFIRSTYPLELGGYANLNGTSMASPHTAGAVALLLQAKPSTPSNAVRDILQNSADPKVWSLNPGTGLLDNVHRQGAGMLDVVGAVTATTRIEPGKLSLGESEAGPSTHTLTVSNSGATAVTYTLSHTPALATGPGTFALTFFNSPAAVSFSAPGITVPAGGSATVDVTITANASLSNGSLYGGYVVFTPQGGGAAYRVPFAGYKGDYQARQVLVPTASGFPWLAQIVGPQYVNRSGGATYTLVGSDVPFILVHLDHQARRMRVDIVEALSGKAWHRALDEEYLGRNSTPTGFFAFAWDGITTAGNKTYTVPNGSYKLKMSVLKALGDEANPAHWETWESAAFTIARP